MLIFVFPNVFAQYHFDSWTTDSGLPQNGVREFTQTPDGFLWFTTFDGLVRFDGVKFTTFNKGNTKGIINNRFTSIASDKEGTIYASTREDGVLTIRKNGVFSSYTSAEVPRDYIRMTRPDENGEMRFFVLGNNPRTDSWYYLRNGKFVFSENIERENVEVSYQGRSGKLWTVSKDTIVSVKDGKREIYSNPIVKFDSTLELFEDLKGSLWIGGDELLRIQDGEIEDLSKGRDFPKDAEFHSFWEEPDGSVWFANGGAAAPGVGLVQYKNGEFDYYGQDVGLSNSSIHDVFRDREGTVWLATNKGINRLRRDVITPYSVRDGLTNSEVYPLFMDSKRSIWIGTVGGLSIYRDGKFEDVNLIQTQNDVPEHTKWHNGAMSVQSIFEDSKGKMWIGVNGGLFIAQNGKTAMLPQSEGHHITSIIEDKAGNIWTGSGRGILRINDEKITASYSVKDGLPNDNITVIREDSKGRLWFGGLGGLSEFKNGKFINYTTNNGLTGNYVRTIYEDSEGVLWIGTYDEGLSRFKDGQFSSIKAKDGLYNNGVFAIEEDDRGNFWMSSNNGIYRVRRAQLNEFADKKISRIDSISYGKQDGMLNSECNGGRQPASLKTEDGKFWFPTQDGVVVVDPGSEISNSLPPSVIIESATVERKPFDISTGLKIGAGQKNVEISYTGVSLIKSEQVRFKYKLEGHDSDWIDAGTKRKAYYSYLPPGEYQFRVIASNSDGIWNDKGASLTIKLEPYFYETTGFMLLCIAFGLLILFIAWKISVHQLESRERRLENLVEKKTRELEKANEVLRDLANSDGLTSIGNRRRFEKFLADEWNRAIRHRTEISLILLDIDHFKLFNDTYGHLKGDECLKQVAAALRDTIHRPADLVARFGGEEFAIVLGGTNAEGAMKIAAEAIFNIKRLNIAHDTSETCEHLTVSVGIASTFVKIGMTEDELVKAADEALYEAKAEGRNQIVLHDLTQEIHYPSIPDSEVPGIAGDSVN
ncbi:MAG: diguanylate cyclase [Acidobacteria bacterium]|nr:diguanylate cyclase [Acidobacteriota bacterium]